MSQGPNTPTEEIFLALRRVPAALIATVFLKEGNARQRILATGGVAIGLVLLRAV